MFTVLMSAYQILLARQSGQDDLVVGTPFACRHGMPGISGSELEQTVGYFVNALPVRGDLTGMPTFGEVVRRARKQLNSTLEHQQMPLPRLVELLNPPRDPSRAPLFDAMFVLQRSQLKSKGDLSPFFMGVRCVRARREFLSLHTLIFQLRYIISLIPLTNTART